MNDSAQQCIQILNYIKNLKTEHKKFLNVDNKDLFYQSSKPQRFIIVNNDALYDDTLLEPIVSITRSPFTPPSPTPDKLINKYVELDKTDSPVLNKNALIDLSIQETNEIQSSFSQYMIGWNLWKSEDVLLRRHQEVYKKWFDTVQRLKEDGDAEKREVVCGFGLAKWSKDGVELDYPLFCKPCDITVDNKEPYTVSITPALAPARLNLDMFLSFGVNSNILSDLEKDFNSRDDLHDINPLIPSTYENILQLLASKLDAKAIIVDQMPLINDHNLYLSQEWIIFEHNRSTNRIVEDVNNLIFEIENGGVIPNSVLKILGRETDNVPKELYFEDVDYLVDNKFPNQHSEGRKLYFPLPFNDEQVEVARNLEMYNGVVVQGPPGTGKSHTIANIISHYLAQGKRILVTSSSAHALEVIQEKIPAEIRSLSVPLLSSDVSSVKDIENSLNNINEKLNSFRNPLIKRTKVNEIYTLKQRQKELSDTLKEKYQQLNKIFEEEVQTLNIVDENTNDVIRSVPSLCQSIVDFQSYNWLDEKCLSFSNIPKFLVNECEYNEIFECKELLGDYLLRSDEKFPYSQTQEEIPSKSFIEKAYNYVQKQKNVTLYSNSLHSLFKHQQPEFKKEDIESLEVALTQYDNDKLFLNTTFGATNIKCIDISMDKILPDIELVDQEIEKMHTIISKDMELHSQLVKKQSEIVIKSTVLKDKEFIAFVTKKIEGNFFELLVHEFGINSKMKEYLNTCSIAGKKPKTKQHWLLLKEYIDLFLKMEKRLEHWRKYKKHCLKDSVFLGDTGDLNSLSKSIEIYKDVTVVLEKYKSLEANKITVKHHVSNIFFHNSVDDFWIEDEWLATAQTTMLKERLYEFLKMSKIKFDADCFLIEMDEKYLKHYKQYSLDKKNILCNSVIDFFTKDLETFSLEVCLQNWDKIENEIKKLNELYIPFKRWNDVLLKLSYQMPNLMFEYKNGSSIRSFTDLEKAWRFLHLNQWVGVFEKNKECQEILANIAQLKNEKFAKDLEEIEQSAWFNISENVKENQLQSLTSFISNISKAGVGKGKRSLRYRKDAQEDMKNCYDLVPCWITPIERISENMPAKLGLFDLVVIDEASQSDITAFTALLRGAKVLVVGDDKQVSPTYIGDEDKMVANANKFLNGIKYHNNMLPVNSIYDLCNIVFSNQRIMLKEHFRCASAIIEFSNKHYYDGKIIPLRNEQVQKTIYPILIDVYVENGSSNARKENEKEAEAIVNEIEKIVSDLDPKMKDKTIGVVTLRSDDKQVLLIQKLISQRISERDRVERRISVGKPQMFQGKERDIVLLSGCYDQCGRMSNKIETNQRLNVAASRAKDRMYLFRSIPDEKVQDNTLYGNLINHFKNPFPFSNKMNDLTVAKSIMQKEIAQRLLSLKYDVQLNSGPGSYNIDIIVYGENKTKIAIQCDEYTAKNNFNDFCNSLKQQNVLERSGWSFWRCFISRYLLDKERVFTNLLEYLKDKNVSPILTNIKGISSFLVGKQEILDTTIQENNLPSVNEINMFSDPVVLRQIGVKKTKGELFERCSNSFEEEVFLLLFNYGYNIYPQLEYDGYKMDFAIWDCESGIIILECDGDTYHSIEHAEADNNRQKYLEKNGFEFIRIYYSEFVTGKTETIQRIIEKLNKHKIAATNNAMLMIPFEE